MLYVRGFLSSLYLCVSAKSHKLGNGLQALEPKKENHQQPEQQIQRTGRIDQHQLGLGEGSCLCLNFPSSPQETFVPLCNSLG